MLVTFKSRHSLPPYRIENHCEDVVCWFAQGALKGSNTRWNVLTPRQGGNSLAYAWDEPSLEHKLLVHVRIYPKILRLSNDAAG